MEAKWRWVLITAVAPITWGSVYFVTSKLLPSDAPLWSAALRALPAALILMLVVRTLPRGRWWWRSLVLGVLNVGGFFVLVYLAAVLLPTSVAASVMALSPVALLLLAWPLAGERPTLQIVLGSAAGVVGVVMIVGTASGSIPLWGIAASAGAMLMWSLGSVLAKRWADGTPVLHTTAWQLVAGGTVLALAAVFIEGAPPTIDAPRALGYAWIAIAATAVAFWCWFTGLRHLPAASVGIVGLLNPVTGVLLGTVFGGEALSILQVVGVALVITGVVWSQRRTRTPRGWQDRNRGALPRSGDAHVPAPRP